MSQIPAVQLDTAVPSHLVQSYINNGFLLVSNVLSTSECNEINTDLLKINRGDYICDPIKPRTGNLDDKKLLGRYMYIGEPHAYSAIIRNYITHPRICSVLDHIIGAHIPFWDGAYKCMQTMFVTKQPKANGSPWHQDEHPIPTRDRSLTGVWIPLVDTNIDNGCLWIIPDSHKSGIIYQRYPHNLPDVDSMPIAQGFDATHAIPIEMSQGSILFFSGYLLHSSRKNSDLNYRPALTMHYCTSSSWLSWKGQNNYRSVIQVRGQDPYAHEGYTTPIPWVKEC